MRRALVSFFALVVSLSAAGASGAAISAISAGCWHSLALRDDGTIAIWGGGGLGQTGAGPRNDTATPVLVPAANSVIGIDAGEWHTLALVAGGSVLAWGVNLDGQLGDGTTDLRDLPVAVSGLPPVRVVAAGGWHSLALLEDGTLRSWGRNSRSQLGNGDNFRQSSSVPVVVVDTSNTGSLRNVRAIAAGFTHSLALLDDGTVVSWGANVSGQLGIGTLTSDERWPQTVSSLADVVAIATGAAHSLALLKDGTVRAWGANFAGQLGDGTRNAASAPVPVAGLTGVQAIAAGAYHSLALLADGSVRAWGYNAYGEAGDGTTIDRTAPVAVSSLASSVAIAAGRMHTLALGADGQLRAWGFNRHGEIGNGTTAASPLPVTVQNPGRGCSVAADAAGVTPVARGAAVVLDASGSALAGCTGKSLVQWEQGATILRPFDPDPRHTVAPTARTTYHARVRCASDPTCEGTAETTVGVLPEPACDVVALASDGEHALALGSEGRVWAWGSNLWGQLGNGSFGASLSLPAPVVDLVDAVAIDAGSESSFALDLDGRVWAWGQNRSGNGNSLLGDGEEADRARPRLVPELRDVKAISATGSHVLALLADGTVWAWGRNNGGQLGDGTFERHNRDTSVAVPVVEIGRIQAIAAGGDAGNVGSSSGHSLALDEDGNVWAWGSGIGGQLGDGIFHVSWPWGEPIPVRALAPANLVAIAAGFDHSLALAGNGSVWAWGSTLGDGTNNRASMPQIVPSLARIAAVSAGWRMSFALRQDGLVFGWGYNANGELGNGTKVDSNLPVQAVGLGGAVRIAAGGTGDAPSLAQTAAGEVWAWGANDAGQLGIGTFSPGSTVPVRTVATWALPAPDVGANSLRAVRSGGDARFSWQSAFAMGSWNLHRSDLKTDLPGLPATVPVARATAPATSDPAAPPAPSRPWLYQVLAADCHGVSVP